MVPAMHKPLSSHILLSSTTGMTSAGLAWAGCRTTRHGGEVQMRGIRMHAYPGSMQADGEWQAQPSEQ